MGIEALLSTQIIDTTTVGRAVMTAADAAEARTAIGAGTSSFSGAYSALSGIPSTFAPSAHKTSHATGGSDALTAADIGAAATSHTHAASDITSGIIATARLATGTASASTYLRGDQTWQAIAAGGISSLNALTDATQTFAVGTAGTNFAISSASGVHTFNLPDASATARGVVTTGTQTIAGDKTFTGVVRITGGSQSVPTLRLADGVVYGMWHTSNGWTFTDGNNPLVRLSAAGLHVASPAIFGSSFDGAIGWGNTFNSTMVTQWREDAANIIGQRNGTNAQAYRVYNTFTSSTSFERLGITWATNVCTIETEKGSAGGTLRGLRIGGATTSLVGFYGATPVDRPDTVADPTGGATIDAEARTAIGLIIDRLQELGLIA